MAAFSVAVAPLQDGQADGAWAGEKLSGHQPFRDLIPIVLKVNLKTMVKLTGLIDVMTGALGVPATRVRTAASTLRKHKMITSGPRGPGAPEMTPTDAVNLLLALAYDDELTKAHETVQRLRDVDARSASFAADMKDDEEFAEPPQHGSVFHSEDSRPLKLGDVLDRILVSDLGTHTSLEVSSGYRVGLLIYADDGFWSIKYDSKRWDELAQPMSTRRIVSFPALGKISKALSDSAPTEAK